MSDLTPDAGRGAASTREAVGLVGRDTFATTHWSVVLGARDAESAEATEALANLCRTYWHPLYAYIRRRGHHPSDAQDLTQEFFYRLLDRHYLSQVDPARGKFRSFLLVAVNHFLANEWDRARTIRRGGRIQFVSFDAAQAEEQFAEEPAAALTAETLFERQWALALLKQATDALAAEFAAEGRDGQFERLKGFLIDEKRTASWAELAAAMGLTEGALKMSVQRLRQRFGRILREQIARTVAGPDEVEAEIRALLKALSG
jgi:RNA polymerase sigma-70 factor (ECF subfamily)